MMRALFLFLVLTLPAPALVPMLVPALPCNLAGRVLWLDDSDSTTLTFTGSNVSAWNDKSGHGNNAVQGTMSAQPTFSATGLNGKPAIIFSGAGQWMGGTQLTNGTYSLFCVGADPRTPGTAYEIDYLFNQGWDYPSTDTRLGMCTYQGYASTSYLGLGADGTTPCYKNGASSPLTLTPGELFCGIITGQNLNCTLGHIYTVGAETNGAGAQGFASSTTIIQEVVVALGSWPKSVIAQLHYYAQRKWGTP